MLLDAFVNLLHIIVNAIFFFVPDGGTFPPEVGYALSYMFQALRTFDWIVPYDTLCSVLTVGLVWNLFLLLWSFIHWVLRKIPVAHIT